MCKSKGRGKSTSGIPPKESQLEYGNILVKLWRSILESNMTISQGIARVVKYKDMMRNNVMCCIQNCTQRRRRMKANRRKTRYQKRMLTRCSSRRTKIKGKRRVITMKGTMRKKGNQNQTSGDNGKKGSRNQSKGDNGSRVSRPNPRTVTRARIGHPNIASDPIKHIPEYNRSRQGYVSSLLI